MTNPHDAFKALASISWDAINHDDLRSFLADTFVDAQCLIDSIPIPASLVNVAGSSSGGGAKSGRPRSATDPSGGGKGAKQQQPPPSRADKLRGEWKEVQVNPRDNPLGVTVYRMGSKDRKGAWFARRSVHAGVSFDRWRRGMEAEFAESLKVQGGPGEGRIRGIGADKRVANTVVDGCGRVEGRLRAPARVSDLSPGRSCPDPLTSMFPCHSLSAVRAVSRAYDAERLCDAAS